MVWHLRGWANNRLIKDREVKYALQQNLGLGGASIVTIYKRADGKAVEPLTDAEIAAKTGLGYNPATQAKGFTKAQAKSAVSQKQFSEYALADIGDKVHARF